MALLTMCDDNVPHFFRWFDQHNATSANEGADEMRMNKREIVTNAGCGDDEYAGAMNMSVRVYWLHRRIAGSKGVMCVK